MIRFHQFLLLLLLITLAACSVGSQKDSVPVKPSTLPKASDLVGKYSLFAGSEISFGVSEQNGKLFLSMFGEKTELHEISPIHYKLKGGNEVYFEYSKDGKYDRFTTISEGRPQRFILNESLQNSRSSETNQSVYTSQLGKDLKPGDYAYSKFLSPSRGLVDYSVYLPPKWKRNISSDNTKAYPLVFFLHGQTGWERSFSDSVPATQLNQWIAKGFIPPMVIVSLRTGRLKGTLEEQWSSSRNESLLTSEKSNEMRVFIREQFRAGMSAKTTAIHGHSRGSRGAIHFALKYPLSFSSAVANAFVSDYALQETMQIAQQNLQQIKDQGIPLRISIGDRDEFALNMGRRASPVIHQFLNSLKIAHDYEVFSGINHSFVEIWNAKQSNSLPNGLGELQFHAVAWVK